MIYSLAGVLKEKELDFLVVECGGIGFLVNVPQTVYSQTGEIGENVSLYTYMNVKEDGVDLYGFCTRAQQECFKLLLGVTGVGPKAALAVLSVYEPDDVGAIAASGDYKGFCACAGIGPKLAQRLVLELKDKVSAAAAAKAASVVRTRPASASAEAISALITMGFTQSEAAAAVAKMPADASAEDMILESLRQFGKGRK